MPEPPILDVHAHHVGTDLVAAIEDDGSAHGVRAVRSADGKRRIDVGGRRTGLPVLPALSDVAARLRFMDDAGVDVQLVAGWMDLAGYHLSAADGAWLARRQNEALASVVAAHPARFRAAAVVPLQDTAAAVAELRHAVAELGHSAVQIGARVEDVGLDDPLLDPFWSEAAELGVPVVVHPAELSVPERHRRLFLHIVVGNPAETTFAAAALLLGGVLERHPSLRVLLVHGGGFLAYQLGRLDSATERAPENARPRAGNPASAYLRQVYCDTVVHSPDALRFLASVHGDDRLLVGSDYPFPMRDGDPVGTVARALDGDAAGRVHRHNAVAFLKGGHTCLSTG
ncbi:MAG: amidohydrolase family protein [Streptosporangiales bacterium]|nr:amidohydrolase family protein [Streptosporangiales bacterium]MBO0891078.1 amidohydrolase family protein [Acidothermales bacterium]